MGRRRKKRKIVPGQTMQAQESKHTGGLEPRTHSGRITPAPALLNSGQRPRPHVRLSGPPHPTLGLLTGATRWMDGWATTDLHLLGDLAAHRQRMDMDWIGGNLAEAGRQATAHPCGCEPRIPRPRQPAIQSGRIQFRTPACPPASVCLRTRARPAGSSMHTCRPTMRPPGCISIPLLPF